MKSALMAGIVGVFLFVASAGLSWWLIYTPPTPEGDTVAQVEDQDFPIDVPADDKTEQMPVSLRPDAGITMESVTELAESIMKKEKRVFEAEQALKKEEQRIQMLFEDLRREQDELDAFAEKVDSLIIEAKEAVKLLQLEKQSISTKTEELSKLEKKTGVNGDRVADLELEAQAKRLSNILAGVDEGRAAEMIKDWADKGKLELISAAVIQMDDRKRAKIVNEIDNHELMAEILTTGLELKSGGDTKLR